MNQKQLKKNGSAVIDKLRELYSVKSFLHFKTPWELLVATLLSAQCTDIRVNKVTPALFSLIPTPKKAALISPLEIEKCIQSVNYFHTKAERIHQNGKIIVEEMGNKVPATMEKLLLLKGVGRKTANVVLAQAFGVAEGIAVDTHVLRVTNRLGWTKSKNNAFETEQVLMKMFPSSIWEDCSILLIHHGRATCKARKPLCDVCTIRQYCWYFTTI